MATDGQCFFFLNFGGTSMRSCGDIRIFFFFFGHIYPGSFWDAKEMRLFPCWLIYGHEVMNVHFGTRKYCVRCSVFGNFLFFFYFVLVLLFLVDVFTIVLLTFSPCVQYCSEERKIADRWWSSLSHMMPTSDPPNILFNVCLQKMINYQ